VTLQNKDITIYKERLEKNKVRKHIYVYSLYSRKVDPTAPLVFHYVSKEYQGNAILQRTEEVATGTFKAIQADTSWRSVSTILPDMHPGEISQSKVRILPTEFAGDSEVFAVHIT
jgi:hypothetical protein